MNTAENSFASVNVHSQPPDFAFPEKVAPAAHSVNELVARRWSPRAFDATRPLERRHLLGLLEAARWAPSCFNEQPWRFLVFDDSDPEALGRARSCLINFNSWAHRAPALILTVARESFAGNGNPNRLAHHDLGLATENLVLEAAHRGLVAHQMGGFDVNRARREFGVPDGYTPMVMIAIGHPGRGATDLPPNLRAMEAAPRRRKSIGEIAFAGRWSNSFPGP
jgi:nitroreductase